MDILKDLEQLEDILAQLQNQGQSLSKREEKDVAKSLRKDLENQNEMPVFQTIAEVAKTVLPLLGPIIALI